MSGSGKGGKAKPKAGDSKRFNIEIQISDKANYDKRALYY